MFEKLFESIDEMIAEQLGVPTETYVEVIDTLEYDDAYAIITPLMTESTDEEKGEAIRKFKEFQEKT